MKNREYYRDEIINHAGENFCDFIKNKVLKFYNRRCDITDCELCQVLVNMFLEEEYQKDEVDWSTIKVDTPIMVSENNKDWYKRYFAKYENRYIYAWDSGATSWSSNTNNSTTLWKYAKLAKVEEE